MIIFYHLMDQLLGKKSFIKLRNQSGIFALFFLTTEKTVSASFSHTEWCLALKTAPISMSYMLFFIQ